MAMTNGAKTRATLPVTASILARTIQCCRDRRGGDEIGRVLAGDRKPGEAAGQLARRHHQHRHEQHQIVVVTAESAPQHEPRRQQIEKLHQGLRGEPRIANEQRPFLAPQRAARRCQSKAGPPAALRHTAIRHAGRGDGVVAEPHREYRDRKAEQQRPALSTAISAVRSPSTARAGHHTTLSTAGTNDTSRSDLRKVKYDSVRQRPVSRRARAAGPRRTPGHTGDSSRRRPAVRRLAAVAARIHHGFRSFEPERLHSRPDPLC